MSLAPAELQRLAGEAERIAAAAGSAILAVYDTNYNIAHKDYRKPLTEADLAAHRLIVEGLRRLTPSLPVLSEESLDVPYAERAGWTRYWLVDPLDGTREFIKKNGEFTVNIALINGERPVLGVVHAPVGGALWGAWRDGGAYRRDVAGAAPRRLRTRAPAEPLVVAGSRSHGSEREAGLLARLGAVEKLALGSSLKFCRIAEGAADLYLRLGPTSEWDTAAAQCVLEEAGGAVLDLAGAPLRYNSKDSLLNPDFLACGDPRVDWAGRLRGDEPVAAPAD